MVEPEPTYDDYFRAAAGKSARPAARAARAAPAPTKKRAWYDPRRWLGRGGSTRRKRRRRRRKTQRKTRRRKTRRRR